MLKCFDADFARYTLAFLFVLGISLFGVVYFSDQLEQQRSSKFASPIIEVAE